MLTMKQQIKLDETYQKLKSKCKHCGHTQFTPYYVEKTICSYCKNTIYNEHFENGRKRRFIELFNKAKKEMEK